MTAIATTARSASNKIHQNPDRLSTEESNRIGLLFTSNRYNSYALFPFGDIFEIVCDQSCAWRFWEARSWRRRRTEGAEIRVSHWLANWSRLNSVCLKWNQIDEFHSKIWTQLIVRSCSSSNRNTFVPLIKRSARSIQFLSATKTIHYCCHYSLTESTSEVWSFDGQYENPVLCIVERITIPSEAGTPVPSARPKRLDTYFAQRLCSSRSVFVSGLSASRHLFCQITGKAGLWILPASWEGRRSLYCSAFRWSTLRNLDVYCWSYYRFLRQHLFHSSLPTLRWSSAWMQSDEVSKSTSAAV